MLEIGIYEERRQEICTKRTSPLCCLLGSIFVKRKNKKANRLWKGTWNAFHRQENM
ncbi:unnamed protein product, partial [Sphenostylis stenocarpa]